MRCQSLAVVLLFLAPLACSPQSLGPDGTRSGLHRLKGERNDALFETSERRGVPAEVLAVLAYQQSRLESGMTLQHEERPAAPTQLAPEEDLPELHSIEHDETERVGIMALNPEQIARASALTGHTELEIRTDLRANIDAAAALLTELATRIPDVEPGSVEAYRRAITLFVGLEPASDAAQLSEESIARLLQGGFSVETSDGERVMLEGSSELGAVESALAPGQYPPIQFIPASTSNYAGRNGAPVLFVIVHDIEGTMPGAIAAFQNPSRSASAHYIVRSSDGHVVQMVAENMTAWHCGNSFYNGRSIGIEHEGFADRPGGGGYYSPTLYNASASLVCAISRKYGIPVDRAHIFGHGNVPSSGSGGLCNDAQANAGQCGGASHHHDPGRYWDWAGFMNRVAQCVRGTSSGLGGAIGAKYDSLGGSLSFLGEPLSKTETATADGVGRFIDFQNGSIYWTNANGAWEVHGNILAKWKQLGADQSAVGYPVSDENGTPDGVGRFNHFQGGSIYWTPKTGAFEVRGWIRERWASLSWERGFLGYPISDESAAADGVGRYNHFQNGSIYWTSATGAWEVHGDIRAKWTALGAEQSALGYPLTNETATPDNVGRFNHFQGGSIYWTPTTGSHEVRNGIRAKWAALGWERSALKYPTTDELDVGDGIGRYNDFQGGSIYWSEATGAHVISGPILQAWKANAALGYPTSDPSAVAGGTQVTFEHGVITLSASGQLQVQVQ